MMLRQRLSCQASSRTSTSSSWGHPAASAIGANSSHLLPGGTKVVVVVTGASVVVVVVSITVVVGCTTVVWGGRVVTSEVVTSSFGFSIPFASGNKIARLAANATRITGFEYFNFKSILLDRG